MNEAWTPDFPSPRAVQRVKHPAPIPTSCRYCHGKVICVQNYVIYGRNYGEWPWVYVCEKCNARIGLHPRTNIPLGTIADDELRRKRGEAKELFLFMKDRFNLSRDEAYAQLSVLLKKPPEETHFGMFELIDCTNAIRLLSEIKSD